MFFWDEKATPSYSISKVPLRCSSSEFLTFTIRNLVVGVANDPKRKQLNVVYLFLVEKTGVVLSSPTRSVGGGYVRWKLWGSEA